MAMWGAPTLEMSDIPGYAHAHAALLGLIARSLGIPAWASRGEAPPMTLQDVLLAELAVEPEDWGMYGVAADHLEDKGDVAGAECLRWLAANHKRARRCVGPVSEGPYQWYAADVNDNPNDPASDLPVALLSEAPQKRILASRPSKFRLDFDSSLDALHCVLMCWRKATAAGWAPPHHTRDGGGDDEPRLQPRIPVPLQVRRLPQVVDHWRLVWHRPTVVPLVRPPGRCRGTTPLQAHNRRTGHPRRLRQHLITTTTIFPPESLAAGALQRRAYTAEFLYQPRTLPCTPLNRVV
jgi:hypothetical protein